jgi:pimeloyl-ACP methyl ester carboxylesterase
MIQPGVIDNMNENSCTFHYNNIAIRYYEYGKGNPIILVHGFGASTYSWRHIYKPLAERNRVIVIDLKGFGLSDKPLDNKYSPFDQADIVSDFIYSNNFESVIVAGHSYGGFVALLTYLKQQSEGRDIIKKLVLIDSVGYKQKVPLFIRILRIPLLSRIFLSIVPSYYNAKLVLKKCFFDEEQISDEIIRAYASPQDMKGAHHALIKTANQLFIRNDVEIMAKYKDIEVPVLVIWGEEDEILTPLDATKFNKDIANSKLAIIPNCGHIPHEEKPGETIKILLDFI